jgi:hypothetical protein
MSTLRSSIVRAFSLAIAVAMLAVSMSAPGCHPQPPSPSGPVTTVSSWTDTARTVLSTVRWAVPAARIICKSGEWTFKNHTFAMSAHPSGTTSISRPIE